MHSSEVAQIPASTATSTQQNLAPSKTKRRDLAARQKKRSNPLPQATQWERNIGEVSRNLESHLVPNDGERKRNPQNGRQRISKRKEKETGPSNLGPRGVTKPCSPCSWQAALLSMLKVKLSRSRKRGPSSCSGAQEGGDIERNHPSSNPTWSLCVHHRKRLDECRHLLGLVQGCSRKNRQCLLSFRLVCRTPSRRNPQMVACKRDPHSFRSCQMHEHYSGVWDLFWEGFLKTV